MKAIGRKQRERPSHEQIAMEWYVPPINHSDVAITPQWVAGWLGRWAQLDPCAHPQQLVYAETKICLPTDGLVFMRELNSTPRPQQGASTARVRGWLNPPWSHPASWIGEACENVAQHDGSWIILVRGDTSTRWAIMLAAATRSYGGWIGVTRARQQFGAIDPARPDVAPVFDRPYPYPCLLAGIGRAVLPPPLPALLFCESTTIVARPLDAWEAGAVP